MGVVLVLELGIVGEGAIGGIRTGSGGPSISNSISSDSACVGVDASVPSLVDDPKELEEGDCVQEAAHESK